MNKHWIYFCFFCCFLFPTEKYFLKYQIPTLQKGNKNRKHIDSLTKELRVCDTNCTSRWSCPGLSMTEVLVPSALEHERWAMSPVSSPVNASGLSVFRAQLISRKKIIEQQERETKSIKSEGGNWRDRETGRGGDLHEQAASSRLGVNLAMMWRKDDMGVGVCVEGLGKEKLESDSVG